MNDKLLIIFNTCGLGSETIDYYRGALDSIYSQTFQDFDITVASCLHPKEVRDELQRIYPKIDIDAVDDKIPIHYAMNHAVKETLKHRPDNYFAFCYFEAGAVLTQNDDLQKLVDVLKSDPDIGILFPSTNHDSGINLHFGLGSHRADTSQDHKLFGDNDIFYIPIGKAINMHIGIYNRCIYDYYNKLQCDIFKAHTLESTFTFLTGAIHKKWALYRDVMIEHRKLGTIDSICFDPYEWKRLGNQNWNHPYIIPDIIERLAPGIEYGIGYEENVPVIEHDESKWDGYYAKDERLAPFLKKALFLSEEELPHDSIKSTWIQGKR